MANTPIELIVIDDPEFGTLTWTPGEHAQGHLVGLEPDEQAAIMEQIAEMAPEHARQLTQTVCILTGIAESMKSIGMPLKSFRDIISVPLPVIEVDLDAFQGPGPSFWRPPVQPRKLDWKAIFNW